MSEERMSEASDGAAPAEIRYGVIGVGMMGIEHIENINAIDGCRVAAICDPTASSIDAAVAAVGPRPSGEVLATFSSHVDLLESGTCDAVVVVTPNFTHFDVVADVLRSGVHALIEKPLAVTTAQCEALVELERDTARQFPDRKVWVGLEYRYMPAVARLVTEVHEGAVGTPRMVSIREHRFPFLVKVGDWNRFSENTGGTLVEKCCHFFDLMNLILEERPTRVFASGAQDVNHLDEVYDGRTPDILDNAFVILDYPSGARAMLDLCMFADATHNQEEVIVIGEKGKLEASLPDSVLKRGRRGEHWIGQVEIETIHDQSIAHEGLHHGSSFVEHLRFRAAILGEQDVEVTLDEGLWSVAIGAAAHRSIREGRPVELAEMFGADLNQGVMA